MSDAVTPFTLNVDEAELVDLGRRLDATRWPEPETVDDWTQGAPLPLTLARATPEATLRPLGIQPPLHRRRLDFFRKSFVFDTSKARSLLSFTPEISFRDGATETAHWYRAQGYL